MKSRFAPSPTGYLHIGGARTAFFVWIYVKQRHGKFILRIEDTDSQRSTKSYISAIIDSMIWLGLKWDEGPYYQSARVHRHKDIIKQLISEGRAYYCQCSLVRLYSLREKLKIQGKKPKYDGCCRKKNLNSGVVRFANPLSGSVVFCDLIKGDITIDNKELDDLIIARSDGSPTYNLTVVVDDHDTNVDCIIRGDDHINNTPRQINLYKALNWKLPQFAHLPMILGSDGKRLSKRHGAFSIMTYRDKGYLAEAVLNYLVRLGWSYKNQEIFSIDNIIKLFSIKNVNQAAANFDEEKLLWFNQEHIKLSTVDNIIKQLDWHLKNKKIDITNGPNVDLVVSYLKQRSKTLVDMANNMLMFYQDFMVFDKELAKQQFNGDTEAIIRALIKELAELNDWQAAGINTVIKNICNNNNIGFGKVGHPLRAALSGDGKAGDINIVTELVGKKRTLIRLNMALDYIIKNS